MSKNTEDINDFKKFISEWKGYLIEFKTYDGYTIQDRFEYDEKNQAVIMDFFRPLALKFENISEMRAIENDNLIIELENCFELFEGNRITFYAH